MFICPPFIIYLSMVHMMPLNILKIFLYNNHKWQWMLCPFYKWEEAALIKSLFPQLHMLFLLYLSFQVCNTILCSCFCYVSTIAWSNKKYPNFLHIDKMREKAMRCQEKLIWKICQSELSTFEISVRFEVFIVSKVYL